MSEGWVGVHHDGLGQRRAAARRLQLVCGAVAPPRTKPSRTTPDLTTPCHASPELSDLLERLQDEPPETRAKISQGLEPTSHIERSADILGGDYIRRNQERER